MATLILLSACGAAIFCLLFYRILEEVSAFSYYSVKIVLDTSTDTDLIKHFYEHEIESSRKNLRYSKDGTWQIKRKIEVNGKTDWEWRRLCQKSVEGITNYLQKGKAFYLCVK